MTEAQLQAAIVAYARLNGWMVFHDYDARRSTPGLPDLLMLRERLVFAELKTDKGVLSEAQGRWLLALKTAGVECHVWRPADWTGGKVDAVLARQSKRGAA